MNVLKYFTKNFITNEVQNYVPFYNNLQYLGCSSAKQIVTYSVLTKLGVSVKIVALILLFL
jgi:hypothetical protein